jgi:hypothetical protein
MHVRGTAYAACGGRAIRDENWQPARYVVPFKLSPRLIKWQLLFRPATAVTRVPYTGRD